MSLVRVWAALAIVVFVTPRGANAQSTTGTISGRVTDPQGLAAPGVIVTARSPNLQGLRTTTTSEFGDYILTLLPSGAYELSFELGGFQPQRRFVNVAPSQVLPVELVIGPAEIAEVVDVAGRSVDVMLRTAQVATTFAQDFLAALPATRDIHAALLMAPSVHPTGPAGNYSIAGAMSFENLFLLNGVTINDNLRGQPHDLYVEDAVQETTIATAGISAEYGRFGGGVVNLITKSGGNTFSGSFRATLTNDGWRALTPFEQRVIEADPQHKETRIDATVPTYEYTLGGPVMRDRLWFFTAGRLQSQESGRTLAITNIPYTYEERTRRFEAKATLTLSPNHRFQGAFTKVTSTLINDTFQQTTSMDLNSLFTSGRPMGLFAINYTGVLSPTFFVDARYSTRDETLSGLGGTTTDLVRGTLLIDGQRGTRFWAPTLCGVCDPEERDNQDLFLKGSYFLSRDGLGSHNVVFGYDGFNDTRFANNHQSGSDYRMATSGTVLRGSGAATTIYPQFLPGSTLMVWQPILVGSRGSNFRTHSLFFNDNWRVSSRVTANLGLRFDKNHGENSVGDLLVKDGAFSPRLGIVVDPTGDNRWSITGSVAKYVAAVANTIADASSPGGNANAYPFLYVGPPINADPNGPLVETADAVQRVFNWFFANGGPNMPLAGAPVIRGVTPRIGASLVSPSALEYAAGVARLIGGRAALRVDFTYRDYGDFYVLRTDSSTGRVSDSTGRSYDLTLVENTNLLERRYAGLAMQGTYRFGRRVDAGASYTLSRAWGNVEGETVNAGPTTSAALQYPEYKQASWNYPESDLSIDQRHRARLWVNYTVPRVTGLTLSVLQILESGVPYGAVSTSGINPLPFVTNPGYLTPPPPTQTVYAFTAPDAFRTEGQRRTDFAVNFVHALRHLGPVQFFGQMQILNVFSQHQLCGCGGTVSQNGGGVNRSTIDQSVRTSVTNPANYQTFNPFASTPVQGVNWDLGPNFGSALNRFAYTTPRTIRLSFGVRF
jgi:hypothetical protein